MDRFANKVLTFSAALKDVYREDEEKESMCMSPLELKEESLTEDFTAMIYAMTVVYREITGDDVDVIGFTHLCNRLAVQKFIEDNGVTIKQEEEEEE